MTLLIAVAGVLFSAAPVRACSGGPLLEAGETYEGVAEVIFTGTVVRVDTPVSAVYTTVDPLLVTFVVDSVQKGGVGDRFSVITPQDGGSCGFGFELGGRYRVLAWGGENAPEVTQGNGSVRLPALAAPPAVEGEFTRVVSQPWFWVAIVGLLVAGGAAVRFIARSRRRLAVATLLAIVLPACGMWGMVSEDEDCGLKPVGTPEAGFRIGPGRVAALCATQVEVDGRTYTVGVGRWLDESALVLEEYGPITRANHTVSEPIAYALQGVDPREFLVMRGGGQDDLGEMGPFMGLWGEVGDQPEGICRYADARDRQYPSEECPLMPGRTYDVEMVVACGLEAAMGPYGGEYWYVVDPPSEPPAGSPYPGMSLNFDYGTIELMDDGNLRYRSEGGADLVLQPSTDPESEEHVCRRPLG